MEKWEKPVLINLDSKRTFSFDDEIMPFKNLGSSCQGTAVEAARNVGKGCDSEKCKYNIKHNNGKGKGGKCKGVGQS